MRRSNQSVRQRWIDRLSISRLLMALFAVGLAATVPVVAQDATTTSITLYWTAPGDNGQSGTAATYDIRYSVLLITESNWDNAVQVANEPTPQSAGNSESFTIEGLEPNTTYYFAVKAGDEVPNWSDVSNVVARSTLQENTPPATIADLSAGNPTENSIALSWTAPGDDGTTGTASEYDIRYSLNPINGSNWGSAMQVNGEPSPSPAGTSESLTVTNLSPGADYYFAIRTSDEVPNWSDLSNVANQSTVNESSAPADIANLTVETIEAESVTLTWHAPGDDGTTGTASQYDIRYSTAPITAANWDAANQVTGEPVPQSSGSTETATINGLDPDTEYYFAVKAADEVPNWSGLSNVVSATTVDNIPPATINDLSAITGESAGELTLSWTAPGDNGQNGIASYYLILYSPDTITMVNWEEADYCVSPPTPLPSGGNQVFALDNLNPGSKYYVAIKALDEIYNASELSNCVSAISQTGFILDVDDDLSDLPENYELMQNYPNPFNPTTVILYAVPKQSHINISVYNILGQLVTTLVDESKSAGTYSTTWDGTDTNGLKVASGIYMYRFDSIDFTQSKKMILVQ
jgi:hypothetical protein